MNFKKVMYVLLNAYYKNIDSIKDKIEWDFELYKNILELCLSFMNQENRFMQISNMESKDFSLYKDEYERLGISLNKITNDLKKMVLQLEKEKMLRLKEILPEASSYLDKMILNSMFEESLNIHSAFDAISFILKDTSFYNKQICDDINNAVGYELFLPQLSGIEKRIISSEDFYTDDIETTFNMHLKKNYILTKIYSEYGSDALNKFIMINMLIFYERTNLEELTMKYYQDKLDNKEFYKSMFTNNFLINISKNKDYDIFDTLFGYENFSSDELKIEESSKLASEIIDPNGMFKELTDEEVAALLYSYKHVNNTFSDIISSKDKYSFKDLTNIVNLINRRKKEGYDKNMLLKLINDITSKKIPLSLEEKSTKKL